MFGIEGVDCDDDDDEAALWSLPLPLPLPETGTETVLSRVHLDVCDRDGRIRGSIGGLGGVE